MVSGVHTYGGEFDGEGLAQVVNQFPAVWVMFAGITDSEPMIRAEHATKSLVTLLSWSATVPAAARRTAASAVYTETMSALTG